MKVLFFGIGRIYAKFKEKYSNFINDELLGFVDNKADQVKDFEGKMVILPRAVLNVDFDFIVIMSVSIREMREQLLREGVEERKILYLEQYIMMIMADKRKKHISKHFKSGGKKVLMVSNPLFYDGGSMAMIYAAVALTELDYSVTLAVSDAHYKLKQLLLKKGINLWVIPGIRFVSWKYLIKEKYDIALVNVYPNIRLACELSKRLPVLWWIHEVGDKYSNVYQINRYIFSAYDNIDAMNMVRISAVTQIAADNFNQYYPERIDSIVSLGIPDELTMVEYDKDSSKITFAIIGGVECRKGQDIFVRAVLSLPEKIKLSAEFLLIGTYRQNNEYVNEVQELARGNTQIKFTGVLDRISMKGIMKQIDVVVCASREETLSIAIIEGMMNRKVCVTTTTTGIADFIDDGNNGFVIPSEDVKALADKMEYIILHYAELQQMRNAARITYEDNFTLSALGDRLDKELSATIREYKLLKQVE